MTVFPELLGTTGLDDDDAGPVPTALVAVTVKVYVSPFVRPVTVIGLDEPVAVSPPLAGVVRSAATTLNDVIVEPPSLAGGVNATVAEAFPAVGTPMTGAAGAVAAARIEKNGPVTLP